MSSNLEVAIADEPSRYCSLIITYSTQAAVVIDISMFNFVFTARRHMKQFLFGNDCLTFSIIMRL